MNLRREQIAWLLALGFAVYALPTQLIEAAKIYIISTVAFITTLIGILFNSPKFVEPFARHLAIELAREFWTRKIVDEKIEGYRQGIADAIKNADHKDDHK